MRSLIEMALAESGDRSEIVTVNPVSGGDVNEAFRVRTKENQYFVKINDRVPKNFFEYEAEGLALLKSADAIAVPDVYYDGFYDGVAMLVLEWVGGERTVNSEEQLGRQLAQLHKTSERAFGLEKDNYLATFTQPNGWHEDWCAFFRDQRLRHQASIAEKRGFLTSLRRKRLETMLLRLDQWMPNHVVPGLLHGDLWGGNWMVGEGGCPYLIDPAVFYGHFEFELAFTECFGGFSQRFYDAYDEVNPRSSEYEERRQLYQLYYLFVHLNMFGEMYGSAVDRVLKKYSD